MRIRLDANTTGVASALLELHRNQIPFAASRAINATLLNIQEAQRATMSRNFLLRRRTWAERSVKIGPRDFATKGKLFGVIRIETPGDPSRSDILGQHERGGIKRPSGSRLAIPVDIRPTPAAVVPQTKRPKAFQFTRAGGTTWRGRNRTFMIQRPDGGGGIFQRAGRGRITTLYRFAPQARLEPRLGFEDTGFTTAQARFAGNFQSAFDRAVATARRAA